uniref:Uncharacterized protein n=1 Tax=Anguilla anguilla TaxID=7936 RepID=A0A0E9Q5G6_ANGAN
MWWSTATISPISINVLHAQTQKDSVQHTVRFLKPIFLIPDLILLGWKMFRGLVKAMQHLDRTRNYIL